MCPSGLRSQVSLTLYNAFWAPLALWPPHCLFLWTVCPDKAFLSAPLDLLFKACICILQKSPSPFLSVHWFQGVTGKRDSVQPSPSPRLEGRDPAPRCAWLPWPCSGTCLSVGLCPSCPHSLAAPRLLSLPGPPVCPFLSGTHSGFDCS